MSDAGKCFMFGCLCLLLAYAMWKVEAIWFGRKDGDV